MSDQSTPTAQSVTVDETADATAAGEAVPVPAGFLWGVSVSPSDDEALGKSVPVAEDGDPAEADTSPGEPAAGNRLRISNTAAAELRYNGITAYRFVVNWATLQLEGNGSLASAELEGVDRFVDELLAAEIDPWICLYGRDLPASLLEDGGWHSRECVSRFEQYATLVHAAVGDRVRHWITMNHATNRGWLGRHVGKSNSPATAMDGVARVTHHTMLAHGHAAAAMRAQAPADHVIGVATDLFTYHINSDVSQTDRARCDAAVQYADDRFLRWGLTTMLSAQFPQDAMAELFVNTDVLEDGDEEVIAQPVDFVALDYQGEFSVSLSADKATEKSEEAPEWLFNIPELSAVVSQPETSTFAGNTNDFAATLRRLVTDYPGVPLYVASPPASAPNDQELSSSGGQMPPASSGDYAGSVLRLVNEGADIRGSFMRSS